MSPYAKLRQRREGGAALILTMLVVTILLVVVLELHYSTTIQKRVAQNLEDDIVMQEIAVGALQRSKVQLIMDLEQSLQGDQSGDGSAGAGGGLMGGGPTGGGTGGGGKSGGSGAPGGGVPLGGGDAGSGGTPVDSLNDDWAVGETTSTLGADAEVRTVVHIVDEDRKVNLLSLFTSEQVDAQGHSYREAAKDRIVRLIDEFRDGLPGDVGPAEARKIVDNIIAWCNPTNRDDKKFPKPPLKSNQEDSSQEKFNLVESQTLPVLPMSMEELMMVDGIDEKLFYGFEKDEQWVPGLEDVLTIYTSLEMGEAPAKKEDTFKLPDSDTSGDQQGGSKTGGSQGKTGGSQGKSGGTQGGSTGSGSGGTSGGSSGGSSGDAGASGGGGDQLGSTNLGRVNLNTATMAVLRSLVPDNFPETLLDEFDKWRDKELKRLKEEREKGKQDKDKFASVDTDLGGDKSERPYPLDNVDQLDEIPAWKEAGPPASGGNQEDPRDVFKHFLTTHSNVFRIDVLVWKPNRTRIKVLRTVVWRRVDGDQVTIVPVIPLQERSLLGIDLIELKKARQEQQSSSP